MLAVVHDICKLLRLQIPIEVHIALDNSRDMEWTNHILHGQEAFAVVAVVAVVVIDLV